MKACESSTNIQNDKKYNWKVRFTSPRDAWERIGKRGKLVKILKMTRMVIKKARFFNPGMLWIAWKAKKQMKVRRKIIKTMFVNGGMLGK